MWWRPECRSLWPRSPQSVQAKDYITRSRRPRSPQAVQADDSPKTASWSLCCNACSRADRMLQRTTASVDTQTMSCNVTDGQWPRHDDDFLLWFTLWLCCFGFLFDFFHCLLSAMRQGSVAARPSGKKDQTHALGRAMDNGCDPMASGGGLADVTEWPCHDDDFLVWFPL